MTSSTLREIFLQEWEEERSGELHEELTDRFESELDDMIERELEATNEAA